MRRSRVKNRRGGGGGRGGGDWISIFSKQEIEVESRGKAGRECEEEGKGEEGMKVILKGVMD